MQVPIFTSSLQTYFNFTDILKGQSRLSVSNVKFADVRLATGISTAMSLYNVTNSV